MRSREARAAAQAIESDGVDRAPVHQATLSHDIDSH